MFVMKEIEIILSDEELKELSKITGIPIEEYKKQKPIKALFG